MSPIYTFQCPAGHSHDALGVVGVPPLRPCPECDLSAERQSVYAPAAIAGSVRTPVDQKEVNMKDFQEAGAELDYAEQRAKAGGDPSKSPSLWKESQRQAADLKRRGVKDSSDFRGTNYDKVKRQTTWYGNGSSS